MRKFAVFITLGLGFLVPYSAPANDSSKVFAAPLSCPRVFEPTQDLGGMRKLNDVGSQTPKAGDDFVAWMNGLVTATPDEERYLGAAELAAGKPAFAKINALQKMGAVVRPADLFYLLFIDRN